MLGDIINVRIMSDGVFSGAGGEQSYTVYPGREIMIPGLPAGETGECGARSPHPALVFDRNGEFAGQSVICVKIMANAEIDGVSYYICAADGVMLFAPMIREVLEGRFGSRLSRMTCLYEKSCGAVIFRRHSGNVEYLLVKNRKGNNWGFPKGHMEMHETERETATREVREETGLNVRLLDGFRTISEYHPKGRIVKQVVFFVAEMPGEDVVIQPSEIERFIWADYSLAIKTFKFTNDKKVLTQAKSWLIEQLY